MLTGVYFSRKLERSRILFCYPRRLFLLLLCLFFFLFSFFYLFFTVFLVRGFFPSFAYRVGCDHLHSSVLWTTRNPQPLSTDCNNLFYLSLVFFFPLFLITFRFPSTLLLVFRCSAYVLPSFISFPFTTVHCSTLHFLVFHRCVTNFSSILCTLLRLSRMKFLSVRILLRYCRCIHIYSICAILSSQRILINHIPRFLRGEILSRLIVK